MKWYNTRLDKLPKDKQEVLISWKGINYFGLYDEKDKCFQIKENEKEKIIKVEEEQLYWTDFSRPGKKK
jgi:hypothetical protein